MADDILTLRSMMDSVTDEDRAEIDKAIRSAQLDELDAGVRPPAWDNDCISVLPPWLLVSLEESLKERADADSAAASMIE